MKNLSTNSLQKNLTLTFFALLGLLIMLFSTTSLKTSAAPTESSMADCQGSEFEPTRTNYVGGDVVYSGDPAHNYSANWWTATTPPGADWTDLGECTPPPPPPPPPESDGVHIYYFPEWGVYGRNYQVGDIKPLIDAGYVDTIQYSFITVAADGSCGIDDPFAALEWATGTNGYEQKGTLAQMAALRDDYLGSVKIVFSLGGWTLSTNFSPVAADPVKRANMVSSCVAFMQEHGFDGIDIDWEFPGGGGLGSNLHAPDHETVDGPNYALMVEEFRAALDAAGTSADGSPYLLTIAVNAGEDKIERLAPSLPAIADAVDYISLMTYDLNGAWSDMPAHNAPLYANSNDPRVLEDTDYSQNYNTAFAVQAFMDAGVPASQLTLGLAFYGRAWVNVPADSGYDPALPGLFGSADNGALDETTGKWCACEPDYANMREPMWNDDGGGAGSLSSDNAGEGVAALDGLGGGSWEEAVYDYDDVQNVLLNQGWTRYWDDQSMSPYAYNPDYMGGSWVSYDDVQSIAIKAQFAADNCLGGVMVWEFTGNSENVDLYQAVQDGMGASTLGLASTDSACPTVIGDGGTQTCESMGIDPMDGSIPVYPSWPQLDGDVGFAAGGDMIIHGQDVYQAAWWTSAEPGTEAEMCTGNYDPTINPDSAEGDPIGCSVAASTAPYCSFEGEVMPAVAAPDIALPAQTSTVGAPVSVTPTNAGASGTFTAENLPDGLTINPNTGEISGTPTTAGSSNVTVTATNAGGSDTVMMTWMVDSDALPLAVGLGGVTRSALSLLPIILISALALAGCGLLIKRQSA